jgi:membrane associated rhomboid family serine protease
VQGHRRTFTPGGMMPPMVKILILVNVAVYLLQQIVGDNLIYYFGLIPSRVLSGWIWQPVTYMFLHGGFFHILFNMFILWMFGRILEQVWGSRRFLQYYFITGIGAGLLNIGLTALFSQPMAMNVPTVGASGAIYGLLLAFGVLFPNQLIYLYFFVPVKAKWMVIGLVVIEFVSGFNPASPVAHFAHLGGMVIGYVYLKWRKWSYRAKQAAGERAHQRHMKVVWDRREEIARLQEEVDELLDKINEDGIESLSGSERRRLKEASQKLKEYERQGYSIH